LDCTWRRAWFKHGVDEACTQVLVKRLHRKQMLPFFSKLHHA